MKQILLLKSHINTLQVKLIFDIRTDTTYTLFNQLRKQEAGDLQMRSSAYQQLLGLQKTPSEN